VKRFGIGCALVIASAAAAFAAPAPAPTVLPPRPVFLADALPDSHGVKRMAVLRALDKVTGRATEINAPAGVPVRFGTLTLTMRTCYTVPPEEPPETSAFLQIDEVLPGAAPKRMFSGWMFASTPALNALEHPTYDVWVITCKTDDPATAAAAPPPAAAAPTAAGAPPKAAAPTRTPAPATPPDEPK
jgi:hypothetical protein